MSNATPLQESEASRSHLAPGAKFATPHASSTRSHLTTFPGRHRWEQIFSCIRAGIGRAPSSDPPPPPKAPAKLAPKQDRVGYASGFSLLD